MKTPKKNTRNEKVKMKKRQYLMTDDGFLASFFMYLSLFLYIAYICYRNMYPSFTIFITEIYYDMINVLHQVSLRKHLKCN